MEKLNQSDNGKKPMMVRMQTWLRVPLRVANDSCIILITCLFHVKAKVAQINNGQATWYTAQSVREETLRSINCPIIKTGIPQWQLESHLLSICAPETPSSLFQKSHSNCLWLSLWLLKCSSPPQSHLQRLSHAEAVTGEWSCWPCGLRPDKTFPASSLGY